MATNIAKSEYAKYDQKSKVSLNNLFVKIYRTRGGETKYEFVPLSELYVNDDGKKRKVKSYADYKKFFPSKVFSEATCSQKITFSPTGTLASDEIVVNVKDIVVPKSFDSDDMDETSYGLKKNYAIEEASASATDEEKFFLAYVGIEKTFLKKNEIYFYDEENHQVFLSDFGGDVASLSDVQLYDKDGKSLSKIYTEKQFIMPRINAEEKVDLVKNEIRTYTIDSKTGSPKLDAEGKVEYESIPIEKYFSQQSYVKLEVPDDKKPGETKVESFVKVTNYEIDSEGEYFAVSALGTTQMVTLDDVVDEDGNAIEDLSLYVGKSLKILEEGEVVATTKPLTYAQTHIKYSTIKTFQETDQDASDNTYLRLKNGEYIKEKETVKPLAYMLLTSTDPNAHFDAFLVKTIGSDGKEKFVILSKDYFEKYGDTTEYKIANAVKVQRCSVTNPDCVAIQTTSKGNRVEQCSVVKTFDRVTEEVDEDAKDIALEAFVAAYAAGEYAIKDVYHNDKLEELSPRKQRYEFTDVTYYEDYADNRHEYKGLKTNNIRIENGVLVGGPKYSIGSGIKSSFSQWAGLLGPAGLLWAGAGILIPVVGPVISLAVAASVVGAVPVIPIANTIYGIAKNRTKTKFTDKAEIQRIVLEETVEQRMEKLYERMTDKDFNPYTEARFNDECDRLKNDIVSLSACSVDNCLKVVDGVAEVTPENASAAKAYMLQFNSARARLAIAEENLEKAEKKFRKLDEKMQKLEDEGRKIDPKFQKKYDEAKAEYEKCKKDHKEKELNLESLKNYTGNPTQLQTDEKRDRLLSAMEMMQLAVYVKTFSDSELVQEALSTLTEHEKELLTELKLDLRNGLFLDGIGLGTTDDEFVYDESVDGYKPGMWKKQKTGDVSITDFGDDGEYVQVIKLERSKTGQLSKSRVNFKHIESGMKTLISLSEKDKLSKEEKVLKNSLVRDLSLSKELIQYIIDRENKGMKTKNCPQSGNFSEYGRKVFEIIGDSSADVYVYQGTYKEEWLNVKNALRMIRDGLRDKGAEDISSEEELEEPIDEDIPDEPVTEPDAEPILEEEVPLESHTDIKPLVLEDMNSKFGISTVKKDGSIKMNEHNFMLLLKKMKRCLELGEIVAEGKRNLTPEEKVEYQDLKFFINSNLAVIKSIINKQENGKNPKFVTSELYDDFFTTRNNLLSVLDRTGVIVKADGTFYTAEDLDRFVSEYASRNGIHAEEFTV